MARKMQQKYICENCNFVTCNKYNYDKHLLTAKHKNTTKTTNTTFSCKTEENIILKKEENLTGEKVEYSCDCGKTYPYRASLYNHKKKCPVVSNITVPKDKNIVLKKSKNDKSKDLIVKLVEENTEIRNLLCKQFETMQNQMWEQQKIMNEQINELLPKIGSNNTINKNNLNINIFLNEQCKDAITMEQFIKQIEVSLNDLSVTQTKGLTEGVSNIFIENMNKLSLYERPLHCTDVKKETVYIKSEDKGNQSISNWEMDSSNEKLKQAIKQVSYIQQKSLDKWVSENPNWEKSPKKQEEYMILVKNCTAEFQDKESKIIKKLCSETQLPEFKEY